MGCVPVAAFGGGVLADLAGIIAPLIAWPALTLVATGTFFVLTSGTTGDDSDASRTDDQ